MHSTLEGRRPRNRSRNKIRNEYGVTACCSASGCQKQASGSGRNFSESRESASYGGRRNWETAQSALPRNSSKFTKRETSQVKSSLATSLYDRQADRQAGRQTDRVTTRKQMCALIRKSIKNNQMSHGAAGIRITVAVGVAKCVLDERCSHLSPEHVPCPTMTSAKRRKPESHSNFWEF